MKTPLGLFFVVFAALILPASAQAQPLSYSHLDAEYGAQSTTQFLGKSFDSDDSYAFNGSYLFFPPVFIWGRYGHAMYDLFDLGIGDSENFVMTTVSSGLGWKIPLIEGDDKQTDLVLTASYEHYHSALSGEAAHAFLTRDGLGLQAGLRAKLAPQFEINASVCQKTYNSNVIRRRGGLDGLFFSVGGVLQVTPMFALTATYTTGEYDNKLLLPLPDPEEVEVDRDEMMVGMRFLW